MNMKVVIVGDGSVGKSCLCITYTTNSFPSNYVPTVFDNYSSNVVGSNGEVINLALWDTAGQEDYDRLRPLSYPQTDIFLVCYSINSKSSFTNIKSKWLPEISHHSPGVPSILVGLKCDLSDRNRHVSTLEGEEMSKDLNFCDFLEVSALSMSNIKILFDKAIKVHVSKPESKKMKKGFSLFASKNHSFRSPTSQIRPKPQAPPMPKAPSAPHIRIDSATIEIDFKIVNSIKYSDLFMKGNDKDDLIYCHRCMLVNYPGVLLLAKSFEEKKIKTINSNQIMKVNPTPLTQSMRIGAIVPAEFLCPITHEIMGNPVISMDGFTYEYSAIKKWLSLKKSSPMTNQPVEPDAVLIPNRALLSGIESFLEMNKIESSDQLPISAKLHTETVSTDQFDPLIERWKESDIGSIREVVSLTMSHAACLLLLDFLYTGHLPATTPVQQLIELEEFARSLGIEYLSAAVSNLRAGAADLNPSIASFLNDQTAEKMKATYLAKQTHITDEDAAIAAVPVPVLYSDLTVECEDGFRLQLHRAVLAARCEVLVGLLDTQTQRTEAISVPSVPSADFCHVMEYVYTDHCSVLSATCEAAVDVASIKVISQVMEAAFQFNQSRLVQLCELYMTKIIDQLVSRSIHSCGIDFAGLLHLADRCRANQLSDFILHFLSVNYSAISRSGVLESALLSRWRGHIEAAKIEQWPPPDYLAASKRYNADLQQWEREAVKAGGCVLQ